MKVALVGATGLVGREMLAVLDAFQFPVSELIPVASDRSLGQLLAFRGTSWPILSPGDALGRTPDLALFSAGADVSRQWARLFANAGSIVIDNSSAWRMDPEIPLVVPEVNLDAIGSSRLIANPNCTTIQLVVVLHPLAKQFGLERIVVSTYQSVTGTGQAAVSRLEAERKGELNSPSPYPHPIDLNCLPQCDAFGDEGYTKEEWKVMRETRKILGLPDLAITCTAVRVPVVGGHSESVNLTLASNPSRSELLACLEQAPGILIEDDAATFRYPMPVNVRGRDEVFVGRIRPDLSAPRSWNLWIVADNLRKGAATNAVQIAQALINR